MKNIGIKTIILFVVILMAVGGVLAFLPTIFQPPVEVESVNLYEKTLDTDIDRLSSMQLMEQNDSIYELLKDKVALYLDEEFMPSTDVDERTRKFAESYVDIFSDYCNAAFGQTVWNTDDHAYMRERMADMEQLKLSDGTPFFTSAHTAQINRFKKILSDYDGAIKLINAPNKFPSLTAANRNLAKAKEYTDNAVLMNCNVVKEGLNKYPELVGLAHYESINNKIDQKLGNYKKLDLVDYRQATSKVLTEIQEYKDNVYKYSRPRSSESLETKANDFFKEARRYYHRYLSLGGWSSVSGSTNTEYDEYKSSSSYYSDQVLRVEVKGSKKYSIRIKSAPGASVVVGLNSRPDEYNNYKIVTSSQNYQVVNFTFEKDSYNTIYIVNYPDDYGNYGSSAMVMIPKSIEG